MITITRAPPYLTVQDLGRTHSRAAGVPQGGAMDFFALSVANAAVGNPSDCAGLEWALGGGSIRFDRDCAFAIGGALASATLSGQDVAPCTTTYARAGEVLSVEQISSGRFLYLACSGGFDVPVLLASRSTYLPGRFGGYEGRSLKTGDAIALGAERGERPQEGFHCPADLMPRYDSGIVHITPGTHEELFDESVRRKMTESEYRISAASDRTGYKLEGAPLGKSFGTLPSEAGCPGTIQVPGDGMPIALMADAPTVGGYPKIAVISEADLPILAQRRPGDTVRFELITIEHSQRALKRRAADLHTISQLASKAAGR
ncbi:MAG TPA: biotin-dependent carboxyltransferase family protein [Gemmatimonadaceae bacterium]|nr:biotin-dependent carboxyltransferase family protein [Gemmatimonadaceae bacterium]